MILLLAGWVLSLLISAAVVVAAVAADKRTALSRRADYHHWLLMNGYTDEKGFLK